MASVVTNRISSSTADVQSTQRCGPARSASRASQAVVAESNVRLIYIAPLPIARLEGLHHGMSRLLEVLVGVLTGRRIAAADVSAAQTFAQLHPTLTRLETFFLYNPRHWARHWDWLALHAHTSPWALLTRIFFLDEPARGPDSRNPARRIATANRKRQRNHVSIMDFRDASLLWERQITRVWRPSRRIPS